MPTTAPLLTRPEGQGARDLHVSRRGLAGLFATGYAAFALSAEAEPIHTDEAGLVVETLRTGADGLPLYVARPEARGRFPLVIVVNEVFGVHEYIKDVCRRLAKLGYCAVAPQVFFRSDPTNALATTTDFATIQRLVAAAHNEQVMGDIASTLAWARGRPDVDFRRIGITGFCWGGAVVWMAAARFPEIKAGAAWYGRLSPPKPGDFMSDDQRRWPLQQVGELKASVLGLYGGKDLGIPRADVEAMRAALKADGRTRSEIVYYPDAAHGFHADYRSSYNAADAQDGWARLQAHFRANGVAPGARRGVFG